MRVLNYLQKEITELRHHVLSLPIKSSKTQIIIEHLLSAEPLRKDRVGWHPRIPRSFPVHALRAESCCNCCRSVSSLGDLWPNHRSLSCCETGITFVTLEQTHDEWLVPLTSGSISLLHLIACKSCLLPCALLHGNIIS